MNYICYDCKYSENCSFIDDFDDLSEAIDLFLRNDKEYMNEHLRSMLYGYRMFNIDLYCKNFESKSLKDKHH